MEVGSLTRLCLRHPLGAVLVFPWIWGRTCHYYVFIQTHGPWALTDA